MSHRDICPDCGQMYALHNEARCQQESNILKESLKQSAVKKYKTNMELAREAVQLITEQEQKIKQLEEKLQIAKEALEFYEQAAPHLCRSVTTRTIEPSYYPLFEASIDIPTFEKQYPAREALEKIK